MRSRHRYVPFARVCIRLRLARVTHLPEIPGDGHISGEYREQGIHGESVWRWDFTLVD